MKNLTRDEIETIIAHIDSDLNRWVRGEFKPEEKPVRAYLHYARYVQGIRDKLTIMLLEFKDNPECNN